MIPRAESAPVRRSPNENAKAQWRAQATKSSRSPGWRTSVEALAPEESVAPLLVGAGFADAYRVSVGGPATDARAAAQRLFAGTPRWIRVLLAVRNRLGALVRLKGADETAFDYGLPSESRRRIGFFPVVSETPNRVVLGFDDWHLDFRVIVDVSALAADRQQVTTTTLVRTHNRAGRAYLAAIMPFHRIIVRTLLARAAKPQSHPASSSLTASSRSNR